MGGIEGQNKSLKGQKSQNVLKTFHFCSDMGRGAEPQIEGIPHYSPPCAATGKGMYACV